MDPITLSIVKIEQTALIITLIFKKWRSSRHFHWALWHICLLRLCVINCCSVLIMLHWRVTDSFANQRTITLW